MIKRAKHEDGFAVATAIIVLSLMLMFGLAMMALADNQTRQSGQERVKETAYNVAEAALATEVFTMSKPWPGTADLALIDCSRASASVRCPDAARMAQGFQGTDFNASTGWTLKVRDNLGGDYYQRSVVDSTLCATATGGSAAPCTWDSNGDGLLWVRAQATVAGRTRTIVTLARQQQVGISLPIATVVAGAFATTNNGKKAIVDELGCAASNASHENCLSAHPAAVSVRCTLADGAAPSTDAASTCLHYDPNKGQLDPDNYVTGFQGLNTNCPNNYTNCALTQDNIDALKRRAIADDTYTLNGCPTDLTGAVVFIDNPTAGNCSYDVGTWNSAAKPGMLIVNHGTISLVGNVTFYGIVYAANINSAPANAGPIVSVSGTATVQGAIMVEGPGAVSAGSSKVNVVYDPNAAQSIYGYDDSAAIVQNSYRELPAGQ